MVQSYSTDKMLFNIPDVSLRDILSKVSLTSFSCAALPFFRIVEIGASTLNLGPSDCAPCTVHNDICKSHTDLAASARVPLIHPFIKPLQRRDSRGLPSRSAFV